jgi:hypothetical protein
MSLTMAAVEQDTNSQIEIMAVPILKAKRAYRKISSLCCFLDTLKQALGLFQS